MTVGFLQNEPTLFQRDGRRPPPNDAERNPPLDLIWPEGCYGSAASALVFVGPSPGGTPPTERVAENRSLRGGLALWNEPFSEPYDTASPNCWRRKYVYSIPTFVATILDLPLEDGTDKLYAFANFDWVQSPLEYAVSEERARTGAADVLRVLNSCQPGCQHGGPVRRGFARGLRWAPVPTRAFFPAGVGFLRPGLAYATHG
jgi:hypothetical protein